MRLPEPAWADLDAKAAMQRLREAQDDHDRIRRAHCAGVTHARLSADVRRWETLGQAIADLAILVSYHCTASHFCATRPNAPLLAARFSESIDDLIDEPAWTVVDAAARSGAVGP